MLKFVSIKTPSFHGKFCSVRKIDQIFKNLWILLSDWIKRASCQNRFRRRFSMKNVSCFSAIYDYLFMPRQWIYESVDHPHWSFASQWEIILMVDQWDDRIYPIDNPGRQNKTCASIYYDVTEKEIILDMDFLNGLTTWKPQN